MRLLCMEGLAFSEKKEFFLSIEFSSKIHVTTIVLCLEVKSRIGMLIFMSALLFDVRLRILGHLLHIIDRSYRAYMIPERKHDPRV